MTFQELLQICKDELGDDGEARFKRYLNQGHRMILNARDWPFMKDMANTFATVASTETYTITETDVKKMLDMRITTAGYEQRIPVVNYDAFRNQYPITTAPVAQGTPSVYYMFGRSTTYQPIIRLFPIPNQVYTIEYDYYKNPPALVNASDTPAFPDPYHELLIDYVKWKEFLFLREPIFREHQTNFLQGLQLMKGDYPLNESAEMQIIQYATQANE